MKTYAIQNTSGQWWTGSCWGVEQARRTYTDAEDVPESLPETNGGEHGLDLIVNSWDEPLDAGYCYADDPAICDFIARIYKVSR